MTITNNGTANTAATSEQVLYEISNIRVDGKRPEFFDFTYVLFEDNIEVIMKAKESGSSNGDIATWLNKQGVSATHQGVGVLLKSMNKKRSTTALETKMRSEVRRIFATVEVASTQQLSQWIEKRKETFGRSDPGARYMQAVMDKREQASVSQAFEDSSGPDILRTRPSAWKRFFAGLKLRFLRKGRV